MNKTELQKILTDHALMNKQQKAAARKLLNFYYHSEESWIYEHGHYGDEAESFEYLEKRCQQWAKELGIEWELPHIDM